MAGCHIQVFCGLETVDTGKLDQVALFINNKLVRFGGCRDFAVELETVRAKGERGHGYIAIAVHLTMGRDHDAPIPRDSGIRLVLS